MALDNLLWHCEPCDEDRAHTAWVERVRCPQHWHEVGHYVCTECGNDITRPIYGRSEPDCIV